MPRTPPLRDVANDVHNDRSWNLRSSAGRRGQPGAYFAYVLAEDYDAFLAVCEDLNLAIMDVVDECGARFAFPSRTVYVEESLI